MKGATHNLVVRTRTDVALYVLNHKRGHLRDLENSFKVTLSIIADPSVSGPQAYLIDRGEQVHTLEAAKALLAAQAAASPPPSSDDAYDDEEPFDVETESEIETDETEGLADEQAGEAAPEQDGQRRRRRRRRRGRGGAREGELREDTAPTLPEPAMIAGESDEDADSEQEGEETEEQPGLARGEQQGGGERRRRRGRRGGRRRRGNGAEEGLAGSIAGKCAAGSERRRRRFRRPQRRGCAIDC
jgi:ribonuclease E